MGAAILISWGPPSWCRGGRHLGVVGAAILDRKSWGPPSWIGSDVIGAIVGPILLYYRKVNSVGCTGSSLPILASNALHVVKKKVNFRCDFSVL